MSSIRETDGRFVKQSLNIASECPCGNSFETTNLRLRDGKCHKIYDWHEKETSWLA